VDRSVQLFQLFFDRGISAGLHLRMCKRRDCQNRNDRRQLKTSHRQTSW